MRFVPALCLAFLLLPSAGHAQAQETTQDTAKLAAPLRAARAALSAAMAVMDATKASESFADSAVVEFGDQVLSGKAAVTGWLTETFGSLTSLRMGTPSFSIGDAEVAENNSYVAVTSDGSEQPGTSTTVWRRMADNSWKVVRLTVM